MEPTVQTAKRADSATSLEHGLSNHQLSSLRISGSYLALGLVWILFSDFSLSATGGVTSSALWFSVGKGIAYVLVSTLFLFLLCRREYCRNVKSQALLHAVVEGTTDSVFVKDRHGKYLLINSAAARFIGKRVHDILGRDDSELFDSHIGRHIAANDRVVMETGKATTVEETLTSAGETRVYQSCKAPFFDVNGSVAGTVGISRNITDLAKTESALRDSEQRYRMLFESNPHPMWVYDVDSLKFVAVNDAAIASYGYSRDEFLGMTLRDIRPAEDVPKLENDVAQTKRGYSHSAEWRHCRKDGTVFDVEISSHSLPDTDQNLRLVLALDITSRKRAEAELRASERRLRLALEAAGAIAFEWDVQKDEVTRYFRGESALPFTSEHPVNLAAIRNWVHPDDLDSFDSHLASALAEGTGYRNEYRRRRPDGTTRNVDEYGYVDRASDGSPLLVTGVAIDVTDRVTAMESLRSSEERLREAARVAGFGVFEHDHLTDTIYRSPRLKEIYGIDQEAEGNRNLFLGLVHPDDRDMVEAAMRRAHEPGGDGRFDIDYRLIRAADNSTCWLSSHSQTQFAGPSNNRHPVRTVGVTVDTTALHLAAETLKQSEARYRQLVDFLPTAIFVHSDNRIIYCNPALQQMLGCETDDVLLGTSPYQLIPTADHAALKKRQEQMASTGDAFSGCEMEVRRCDGRIVPVFGVAAPIVGYGQAATLVAFCDLTDAKRVTAQLRSVLDSVEDAILTINSIGNITSANSATERLFGFGEDELLELGLSALISDTQRKDIGQDIAGYISHGSTGIVGAVRSVFGLRKDGSTFPAELNVTEFARDGEQHFTAVLRDVSARRELEEQLRHAQKMEAIGRLAGGVAHDFNNLLTVINGYCQLTISDLTVSDDKYEALVAINDAGERAARLTKQLLALSRRSVLEPRLIDLNDLVAESANLFRRLIGEDIALIVQNCSAPVKVFLDPGHLEQVLMNLVVNARDAMASGGVLTIGLQTLEVKNQLGTEHQDLMPGKYVSLSVSDTGCGISSDVKDKIFEPFFTTKGYGSGLGLSVVHGVVKQSGGSISVKSGEGEGTTFRILLPAAEELSAVKELKATDGELGGSETILVVEDEVAVQTLMKYSLEAQGYEVLTAASGDEAIQLTQDCQRKVDLMVTDIIMPGMSGRELAERIRAVRPVLRILYISGYTDDALSRLDLDGTSDRFLQKPFTPLGLTRKVRTMLDEI